MIGLLYRFSPNARHAGMRWILPGSLLATVLWIVASAGFSLYVANFGSYSNTYGSLAGVIVLLIWLWLTNMAVVFGAQFAAELERTGRAAEEATPPAGWRPSSTRPRTPRTTRRLLSRRRRRAEHARQDRAPPRDSPCDGHTGENRAVRTSV